MNKLATVSGMCTNDTRVKVVMEEGGEVKSYLEEELDYAEKYDEETPPPSSPTFRRKKSVHFNLMMGKRLDASMESVYPPDDVKKWREKCNPTHAELCESAVFLENGVLGWDVPKYDGEIGPENYWYYRLWRSRIWKRFYVLIVVVHLSFIFFEPAHSSMYDHTDKTKWDDNVMDISTRVDRAFELLFVGVYVADLWIQYKAIGLDSFKADYLYMNSLSCIPQIHVCFVIPAIALNTFICLIYPPFPQFSRALRPLLAFRKLLNVNKIAVAITSASKGLFEILLLLVLHIFLFSMLGYVLFSTVASDRQDGCDFEGDRRGTARFCSSYDSRDCNNYFSSPSWSSYHLMILLTTANYPDVMLPTYRCGSGAAAWFFVIFLLLGLYLLLNLVTAIVYSHYSSHVSDLMHLHQKRRGGAMTRVYRILNHSYGSNKGKMKFAKKPSKVLSLPFEVEEKQEEEKNISLNDEDTIELAALSPISRKKQTKGRREEENSGIHLEEWMCMLDVMRVSKIRRCPTQLLLVVFKMFASVKKDGETCETLNLKEFKAAISLATELEVKQKSRKNISNRTPTGDHPLTYQEIYQSGIGNEILRDVVSSIWWQHSWNTLLGIYCFLQFANYEVESRNVDDSNVIDIITSILLFSFVIEVVISMLAIGVMGLWRRSAFDRIDIILVVSGTIGEIIGMSIDSQSTLVVDILPLFRILRLLRLLRATTNFRVVVGVLFRIGSQLMRYVCVLFLLFYFYASIGMEIFAYKLDKDISALTNTSYGGLDYYPNNFNTPGNAFVVLVEQMVVNQWPVVMEGLMITRGYFVSIIYFVSFHMMCVLVVTNVVIAFMIDVYQSVSKEIIKKEMRMKNDAATRAKKKSDEGGSTTSSKKRELWRVALDRCAADIGVNTSQWRISRHRFASGLNLYGSVSLYSDAEFESLIRYAKRNSGRIKQ